MLAITSISPKHANFEAQARAVKSWIDLGLRPVTMNHRRELPAVNNFKRQHGLDCLRVVETDKTMFDVYGKHYVEINAMIDYSVEARCSHQLGVKSFESFCLINSDIELYGADTLELIENKLRENAFVHACRHDYIDNVTEQTTSIPFGIDVFFFNWFTASQLKYNNFCMGQCWWDYWIPFSMIRQGIKTYEVVKPFAYHKKHNVQWNPQQWEIAAKFFLEEHGDECRRLGFVKEGEDVRKYIRENSEVIGL